MELKNAAHKAKNSFQIMGLKKTAENLKQIEIECEENTKPNFSIIINHFISDYEAILKELENDIEI